MRVAIIFFIIVLSVVSSAFGRVKVLQAKMPTKNPMEYVFAVPKDSLSALIANKLHFSKLMLLTIHNNKDIIPSDIYESFIRPENNSDIFLWCIGYYGFSKIYYRDHGAFFQYEASFYLHFQAISKYTTKVIVRTINPQIIVGREWFPYPPHFVRLDKTLDVEPSTIEEYEILLKIGNLVNEKNMPALILPN